MLARYAKQCESWLEQFGAPSLLNRSELGAQLRPSARRSHAGNARLHDQWKPENGASNDNHRRRHTGGDDSHDFVLDTSQENGAARRAATSFKDEVPRGLAG